MPDEDMTLGHTVDLTRVRLGLSVLTVIDIESNQPYRSFQGRMRSVQRSSLHSSTRRELPFIASLILHELLAKYW